MNKLLGSAMFTIIFFLTSIYSNAQFSESTINPIQLDELKFSKSVEVRSRGGSEQLTSSEARQLLRGFLSRKAPQKLKLVHEGYSKDKSSFYGIVQFQTNQGQNRIFYYCEKENGEYKVTKLRIHER